MVVIKVKHGCSEETIVLRGGVVRGMSIEIVKALWWWNCSAE